MMLKSKPSQRRSISHGVKHPSTTRRNNLSTRTAKKNKHSHNTHTSLIIKRKNTTTTKTQPQYLNIPITPWEIDASLPESSKTALAGASSIFYRPIFADQVPPKAHLFGEFSFPFTAGTSSTDNSPKNNKTGQLNSNLPFNTLSEVLCQSLLHKNFIPQPTFEQSSKSAQINKNKLVQPQSDLAKDILGVYTHHLQYHTQPAHTTTSLPRDNIDSKVNIDEISPQTPLPAYLLQGSFHHIKNFTSSLKSHVKSHYSLSPKLLSQLFNVDIDIVEGNNALQAFLQQRHLSLLSSFLLGRLLVAIDSNYNPIHIVDLPSFQTSLPSSTISSTNDVSSCADVIANVLEKQSSPLIPLTFLPRQRYGTSLPNPAQLRAMSLDSIKIHHGFAEPPKPHPKNPQQSIKTLAPLPTTLQHIQLGYILPLPLFTSILASQSSTTFTIPAATNVVANAFNSTYNPAITNPYTPKRTFYGGFNNFVPTRIDYVTIFQTQFAKWSKQWLTSRSRLPQLNILDMGCGTGVLALTAQDIFHHMANVQEGVYTSTDTNNILHDPNSISQFNHFVSSRRPQPFQLNITAADVNSRAVNIARKNSSLLLYYHENEPDGEYVHGDLINREEIAGKHDTQGRTGKRLNQHDHTQRNKHQLALKSKRGSQYSYGINTQCIDSDLFNSLPSPEPKPALLEQSSTTNPNDKNSFTTSIIPKPFYDLVVFNPPWLPIPQRSTGSSDRAIYDNKFETLTTFLMECKSHLRSSQPFYQHLYRHVKVSTEEDSDNDNGVSNKQAQQNSFVQNGGLVQKHQHVFELNTSEVWIIISDLFQNLQLDETLPDPIIHKDITLGKKNPDKKTKKTNNNNNAHLNSTINPSSAHFHKQYPAQSRFISYLEQTSGLVLTNITETHSHNLNISRTNNTNTDGSFNNNEDNDEGLPELNEMRSKERVMLYVLRDINV